MILTYSGRTTVWLMYSTLLVKIHFISYIYVGISEKTVEAWKTQNAKIIIKNDHGSVANRCYKANDF